MVLEDTALVHVGWDSGSSGEVVVGTGSSLSSDCYWAIGEGGNGLLCIEDGGVFTGTELTAGFSSEAHGDVTVRGIGSSLDIVDLRLGAHGEGHLTIESGASVLSETATIGQNPNSFGKATIAGPGASWNHSGVFIGNGIMQVEGGAEVIGTELMVGSSSETHGDITVSGIDSSLDIVEFTIGDYGEGSLTAESGASVCSETAFIGRNPSSFGEATITGPGTSWTYSDIDIGNGLIQVENGAEVIGTDRYVNDGSIMIGVENEGIGSVIITGESTRLTSPEGCLNVGGSDGDFQVLDGAVASLRWGFIANHEGSKGSVTVEGEGSRLDFIGESLIMASQGNGELSITNGGSVNISSYLSIAYYGTDSMGTVTVSGGGSRLTIQRSGLTVGREGTGTLLVDDGALVESQRGSIASFEGSIGNATVTGAGSQWNVAQDLYIGGRWDSIDGGVGVLTISDSAEVTVGEKLVIHALGTLDLTDGKMLVGEGDASVDLGTLLVSSGGTLSGNGQIIGDVLVTSGVLSPGQSPGTLHIQGDLELTSESELIIEIAGSPDSGLFDILDVSGDVYLDGQITFDFTDFNPSAGMSYDFLRTSGNLFGAFSPVEVLGLPLDKLLFDPSTGQVTAVPEPCSVLLVLSGILVFLLIPRRIK